MKRGILITLMIAVVIAGLLVGWYFLFLRSCLITVTNVGPGVVVRVEIWRTGEREKSVVLQNLMAGSSTTVRADLKSGAKWRAVVECDGLQHEASLGTVQGQQVREARVAIESCKVQKVHYK